MSGFAKVLWVIAFVLFSYLGVFAYLLTQGRGMAERNQAQANEAREELRHIIGFSAADEIVKLDKRSQRARSPSRNTAASEPSWS